MPALSAWVKTFLCMRLLINQLVVALPLCFLLVSVPAHSANAADRDLANEQALWTVWGLHQREPDQHDAAIVACQKMRDTSPANPLLVVSRGIAAWHLLQSGKTNEAVTVLKAMLSSNRAALPASGNEMALRWLTRIEMERVKRALDVVYNERIEYPETLAALKKLPEALVPPLTDCWKTPWDYRLTGFKRIKGLANQRYVLQSSRLGADSDLQGALGRPYACRTAMTPVSVSSATGGKENIMFKTAGDNPQKLLLSEGATVEGITLAYCGLNLLILSNGDYWLVMPKPRQ